jgi:hypothetical protein
MASVRDYLRVWYRYYKSDIKPEIESPEILAGREAEDVLRNIVNGNYQFQGCYSFSSKRIYNPQVNGPQGPRGCHDTTQRKEHYPPRSRGHGKSK